MNNPTLSEVISNESENLTKLQAEIDNKPDVIELAGEYINDKLFNIIHQTHGQLVPGGREPTDAEYLLLKNLILKELS